MLCLSCRNILCIWNKPITTLIFREINPCNVCICFHINPDDVLIYLCSKLYKNCGSSTSKYIFTLRPVHLLTKHNRWTYKSLWLHHWISSWCNLDSLLYTSGPYIPPASLLEVLRGACGQRIHNFKHFSRFCNIVFKIERSNQQCILIKSVLL